jgi:Uma2 family endonuclease
MEKRAIGGIAMIRDYGLLDETDEIFEVWDGEKIMMTPSSPKHESILGKLFLIVGNYVFENDLGELFLSNTAVYFKDDPNDRNFRSPDLTFVSNERMDIIRENGIYGAPDLVVEVLSPGMENLRRDMIEKFQIYLQYGVREYWIVNPESKEMNIFILRDGKYELSERSEILPGLTIPLNKIFETKFDT